MPKNFKLLIEYDGTSFHGWQNQPGLPTIQEEIQTVLRAMTHEKIIIHGSGRTDAGVHALNQVATFVSETRIIPDQFRIALNQMLPLGIVIKECRYVPESFHARYSAIRKTYRYRILNREIPRAVGRNYLWHIRQKLDLDAMKQAAVHIVGEYDFKSFEGTGSPRVSTVRRVERAEFTEDSDMITFDITANGFLKNMVRNIVGTLVDVGKGRFKPEDIPGILNLRDRTQAGETAPAQGLFLLNVEYEPH